MRCSECGRRLNSFNKTGRCHPCLEKEFTDMYGVQVSEAVLINESKPTGGIFEFTEKGPKFVNTAE